MSDIENIAKALMDNSSDPETPGRTNLEKLATIALLHEQVSRKLASENRLQMILRAIKEAK
jgi:hypothetical protein